MSAAQPDSVDITIPEPLPRSFYDRDTTLVSRELLGKWLVFRQHGQARVGRIVETEAYLGPKDLAAHSSHGKTDRTRIMFGPPGYAYVYLIYGIYHLMNIVTEPEGVGTAVLLRALEPVANLPGKTNGPGLLCKAMGINLEQYGDDLLGDELFVTEPAQPESFQIVERPRIGVDYAGEWAKKPLRFYIQGNKYVSRK